MLLTSRTLNQSADLSQNKLTGSIPSSLTRLTNLQSLYLSYNNLTGLIPQLPEVQVQQLQDLYVVIMSRCSPTHSLTRYSLTHAPTLATSTTTRSNRRCRRSCKCSHRFCISRCKTARSLARCRRGAPRPETAYARHVFPLSSKSNVDMWFSNFRLLLWWRGGGVAMVRNGAGRSSVVVVVPSFVRCCPSIAHTSNLPLLSSSPNNQPTNQPCVRRSSFSHCWFRS